MSTASLTEPGARWALRKLDRDAYERLRADGRWPDVSCRLLALRGITAPDQAEAYLTAGLELCHPPLLLEGMQAAVERLQRAYQAREAVGIIGDYDVDGVTSTVLLCKLFGLLGLRCEWRIPDRLKDGYGPNAGLLAELKAAGCAVLLTVDCGISALGEADEARRLGLDYIVTDHHEPGPELPKAFALINPKTSPRYPYKMLAGVAVAFKAADALLTALQHPQREAFLDHMLELVALGSICDVAPLDGENRALVKAGLQRIRQDRWLGLRQLCKAAGIQPNSVDAGSVGFQLGPRLNAGGRIGDAGLGVRLLLGKEAAEVQGLAESLDRLNRERQAVERGVLADADAQAQPALARNAPALVLWSTDWHPGVVGLAASRLLEKYRRPVFVFGIRDGVAKGSARCAKPFHLVRALEACASLLLKFGGHAVAAGATVDPGRLEEFRVAFEGQAAQLSAEDRRPVLKVDMELGLGEADAGLLDRLQAFEPHGMGNARPLFLARGLRLLPGSRTVGADGAHLKLQLSQGSQRADGIAWRLGPRLPELQAAPSLDAVFQVAWNEWNGKRSPQLEVRDIRPSGLAVETED